MYAAMVTGPQNMAFNDMTLTPEEKRDIILGAARPAGERVSRRLLGSLGLVSGGGPVHLTSASDRSSASPWITAKSN